MTRTVAAHIQPDASDQTRQRQGILRDAQTRFVDWQQPANIITRPGQTQQTIRRDKVAAIEDEARFVHPHRATFHEKRQPRCDGHRKAQPQGQHRPGGTAPIHSACFAVQALNRCLKDYPSQSDAWQKQPHDVMRADQRGLQQNKQKEVERRRLVAQLVRPPKQ